MPFDELVTRRQAELQWNVSRSSLLRAEKAGLKAHRQGNGEVRYARHDIEALAAKMRRSAAGADVAMDAESVASIFDLLEKRVSLADIVRQKRLHPDAVESIAARWRRMKEARFVLTHHDLDALMDAIGFAEFPVIGTFDELLAEIRKHRETVGASTTHGHTNAATVPANGRDLPTLPELLVGLSEKERAVVLADEGFVTFVEEQFADHKDGAATHSEALASIERAIKQSLKRARFLSKKSVERTRPRKGSLPPDS